MSLMKSSEGKRFSGELRIFISHTRNLTCRLVGSGNLSHEIVVLRVAPSPAAFGNYLTHRLPLDRLPSVEMHLLSTKSALFPLPMSLHSWCRSPAATKGSPVSSQEPGYPLPGARSLGKCNYISDAGWLCRCCAHRAFPQQNQVCTTEPPWVLPWVSRARRSPTAPHQGHPGWFSSMWCLLPIPIYFHAWGGLAGATLHGLMEERQIWGCFNPPSCWVGMFWGARPPGMQGTRHATHMGLCQAFMAFWAPRMFDAHTLSPDCVKYGARMLSNTQTWWQFTPGSLLGPQTVLLLAGSRSLLWLDQVVASPGAKHSPPPWGANCHSII